MAVSKAVGYEILDDDTAARHVAETTSPVEAVRLDGALQRQGPSRPAASRPPRDDARAVAAAQGISAGQVFADILMLAAFSCQAPFAVVSVPQPGGQWSTLSHGFDERAGLNDHRLFDAIADRTGPVELAELAAIPRLAGSPLVAPPHEIRWAYGVALRGPSGSVLGVVAVLDRSQRDGSRRDRRAMLAVARQMTGHLSQLRKVASVTAGWPVPPERELYSVVSKARDEGAPIVANLRRAVTVSEGQQLLRSHEVAVLFDVTERTVINWAAAGKLPSLRTMGGHLRFRSEDVLELLAGRSFPAPSIRSAR